jgi:ribosomal protein L11 methyltransferase
VDKYYYELTITPSGYYELYLDLVSSLVSEAIEELDNSIIIRSEDDDLQIVQDGIITFTQELNKALNSDIKCDMIIAKKENQDWVKTYQKSVKAIEVGEFYIHPSWEDEKKDKINILIDPALTFGSGHHETTNSCLSAVSKYIKPQDRVLDVGCGSGILSIASAKLNAIVDICDTDKLAVEDSLKNFQVNGVVVNQHWEGSANNTTKQYDVVIANIVADVLAMIHKDLKSTTKEDGILILSGIMQQHQQKVLNRFQNYKILETIEKNGWVTLIIQNKKV